MPQKYIFEPSPSLMKSGLFKALAKAFVIQKLHPNTQLFTASDTLKDFPGRSFLLHEIIQVNKKALKKILPDMKVNLSTRNFPMPVADLKKKLGIKDGGEYYIFACTLQDESKRLLLCKKIKNQ
ncbi:SAM-dependent methyltransferase, partial [Marivirga lumbricoides]